LFDLLTEDLIGRQSSETILGFEYREYSLLRQEVIPLPVRPSPWSMPYERRYKMTISQIVDLVILVVKIIILIVKAILTR
jgi:hypothetical protein